MERGVRIWLYYWLTGWQTTVSCVLQCILHQRFYPFMIGKIWCFQKVDKLLEMFVLHKPYMPVPVGETNAHRIQQNVQSAIGGTMSMFCLGFGNDVDHSFLDVMCKQNKGLARRIFEGSDVVVQLKVGYKIKLCTEPLQKGSVQASLEVPSRRQRLH